MSSVTVVASWGCITRAESSKTPASELMHELPSEAGDAREQKVKSIVLRGDVPIYIQSWVPVPVSHGGLKGTFYCLPDFLSIGCDSDYTRVRINPRTAEEIGKVIGGILPTRKMVNDIYANAGVQLVADPWGPPYDNSMMRTIRWALQDAKITHQASNRGVDLSSGILAEGHLKNMVVGAGLAATRGLNVGIYGWFKDDGTPIQGPGVNWKSHEVTYTDYSHGTRLVYKDMLVGDEIVAVQDVLLSPDYAKLISDEGPLAHSTYLEFSYE